MSREACLDETRTIGSATLQVIESLLEDSVLDRLPTAGRLLRLGKKFGEQRLEAACCRALLHDDPNYKTVKRILVRSMEQEPASVPAVLPPATTFARSRRELMGMLVEVEPWN